jgi:hypothetical protein
LEHTFSVEIISRNDVRQVILSDPPDSVLFEGTIGELEEIALVEDASLEIKGTKGVIRIDLTRTELGEVLGSTDPGGRG